MSKRGVVEKISLVLAACAVACSSDPGGESGADAGSTPDTGAVSADAGAPDALPEDTGPAAICNAGARWTEGTTAFREVTSEWGLDALDVRGVRLSAVDLDGDGWVDLVARLVSNAGDDFAPGGARRSWVLKNTGEGRFEDITEASGLWTPREDHGTLGRPGQIVAFADVDNDGDLDAYSGMSTGVDGALPGETSEILLNDGSGRFVLATENNGIRRRGELDAPAGASFTDYDRDGLIDLWIGQHNTTPAGTNALVFVGDRLYRGDGSGAFSDVTRDVGLETRPWNDLADLNAGRAHSRAWSAAACDLDGDGTPELLTASYGRAPNHLFEGTRDGDGNVSWTNSSTTSGYAFDANQDWTDNEFAKCYCAANRLAPGCTGVEAPRVQCSPNWDHANDRQPFRLGGNSGTTVCTDVTNDGHLDLLTTEITHWWAGSSADRSELLINTGEPDVRFERPGPLATGLDRPRVSVDWDDGDMTAAVFDFDNDGWPDVYLGSSDYPGTRGWLYHQVSAGLFEPVPITEGINHPRSHGVAVADFDRDGDLDVIVGHSNSRCGGANDCYSPPIARMFENQTQNGNWVQLQLTGAEGTNRAAIGARVTVRAGGVTQTQEVGGGHGHYGMQNDLVLHFGLGAACEAEVEIRWPDAGLTTETLRVVSGWRFHVTQGAGAEAVPR